MNHRGLHLRTDAPANGTTPPPITLPDRRDLEAWILRLPVAHTGELSRILHGALKQLRDAEMDDDLRLETLEALRAPMASCQQNLNRHYRNHPLPVPGKGMRVFHLATSLHYNMAQGYMRVLDEARDHRWLLTSSRARRLALCAQRAWHYMGQALADYRHFNLPAPSGLWRHMYLVLRKAKSLGVEKLRPHKSRPHSALDEFIAQLLLDQFPDQQLDEQTLENLRAQCRDWAQQLRLDKRGSGEGLYILDNSDRPPTLRVQGDGDATQLFLSLAPLLKQFDKPKFCANQEIATIARRCLGSDGPREERLRAEGERTLIYGLFGIFQTLLGRCDEPTRERLASPRHECDSDEIVLQEAWLSDSKSWVPVYGRAPRHWSKRFQGEVEPHNAQLENDSPGGICLSLTPPNKPLLHTGGVVGIEQCAAETRLGLIRWIRPNDKELRLGIEWLADKPHPVQVRISDEGSDSVQAALLAFDGAHGIVICPRLPGIQDKALWLEVEGEAFAINTQQVHSESRHMIAFHSPLADEALELIEKEVSDNLESGNPGNGLN